MLKIALIQQAYALSKQAQLEASTKAIKQAARKGAKLVCLSELHQSEYFCQSENVAFFEIAKDYEKDVKFWSKIARENDVVLITSLFEKRAAGLYHNTAVVFERDGSIAGKYRKMHIPDDPNFYEKFYFTSGDLGFEPINTSVGRLGILICWDQWFPEAARIMALKGAQILIYPTAIGHFDSDTKEEKQRQLSAWLGVQRAHAIANGLFVAAINRVGFEAQNLSQILQNSDKDLTAQNSKFKDEKNIIKKALKENEKGAAGIRFWGHSFIYGAQGEEILMAGDEAGIFMAELDLARAE